MNNDTQTWVFNCKTCGGESLNVTRIWTILAGPESETWQEWGSLKPNHHWRFEFKEKVEKEVGNNRDDEVEEGDLGELIEEDSSSVPEEYEVFEQESDPGGEEFYVTCASCDREIEFGWSKPDRGGLIFPAECSDFNPELIWPEPRYLYSWHQKHWLRVESSHSS
jgi:hypothetical protein